MESPWEQADALSSEDTLASSYVPRIVLKELEYKSKKPRNPVQIDKLRMRKGKNNVMSLMDRMGSALFDWVSRWGSSPKWTPIRRCRAIETSRSVSSGLDRILNAALTGVMSPRRISVAFLMCTTMGSSSSDIPDSMSRMLRRGGGPG